MIPNEPFAIELIEYTGIDRTPMMAHHNDPGASFFNVGYLTSAPSSTRCASSSANGRSGAFLTTANPAGPNATDSDPDGMIIEVMHGGWDGPLKSFPRKQRLPRAFRRDDGMLLAALTFYRDCSDSLTPGFGGGAAGEHRQRCFEDACIPAGELDRGRRALRERAL